eukprot:3918460-Rhodomonas_salina.1
MRDVLELLGFQQGRTLLSIDNVAAILLSDDPTNQQRTRHIERHRRFITQCVRNGSILTVPISGADNPADITTKPLGDEKCLCFRDMLGVVESETADERIKASGASTSDKQVN